MLSTGNGPKGALRFWNRRRTDHDERIAALESTVKLLRVEWEEVYDKMQNALARLRKRDRDADKAQAAADEPENGNGRAALWARAKHLLRGDHVRR
jgi:hypothetical protein